VCQNPSMPATVTAGGAAADTAPRLAMLRISGADARIFLQGQLSNDMNLLSADRLLCAGLHSPQGRVLALLWLTAPSVDEIFALLPAELAATAANALRRFVLRARVNIEIVPVSALIAALPGAPAATVAARVQAIANGQPQIYAASSGQFIAQMLNLDCVGAISFTKGCYTGQEVIARAHYRGRVKRRMQRFATSAALPPTPGTSLRLADGRTAQLVDSVTLPDGSHEFLAVAPLPATAASTPTSSNTPDTADAAATAAPSDAVVIACVPLPLPYTLPQ
jgi:tRNA-modifying protein YgfZ